MTKRSVWFKKNINILIVAMFVACPMLVYMHAKRYLDIPGTLGFYFTHESYEHAYEDMSIRKQAKEIKKHIPYGSKISYSMPSRGRHKLFVNYEYIHEYKFSDDWDYYIDFSNSFKTDDKNLKKETISGVNIYIKQDAQGLVYGEPTKQSSRAMNFVFFLGIVIWHGLVGMMLMSKQMVNSQQKWPASLAIGFSIVCGLVVFHVPWMFLMLTGLKLEFFNLILFWTTITIAIFFYRKSYIKQVSTCFLDWDTSKQALPQSLPQWIVLGIGAYVLLAAVIQTTVVPPHLWDEFSYWLLKAKEIYINHQNIGGTSYPMYPIFWPLMISNFYTVLGGIDEFVAKWLVGLFFTILFFLMIGILRVYRLQYHVILGLLGYFFAFLGTGYMISAYAETLFIMLFSVMVVSTLLMVQFKIRLDVCWLLPAIGLVMTKQEGFAAVLFVFIALVLSLYFTTDTNTINTKDKPKITLVYGLFTVSVIALFYIWSKLQLNLGIATMRNVHYVSHLSEYFTLKGTKSTFLTAYKTIHAAVPARVFFFGSLVTLLTLSIKKIPKRSDLLFLLYASVAMILFILVANFRLGLDSFEFRTLKTSPRLFSHSIPALFILGALLFNELLMKIQNKARETE